MPMKDVQFVLRHQIQIVFNDGDGKEMTGRIKQETAMRKPWEIHNQSGIDLKLQVQQRSLMTVESHRELQFKITAIPFGEV